MEARVPCEGDPVSALPTTPGVLPHTQRLQSSLSPQCPLYPNYGPAMSAFSACIGSGSSQRSTMRCILLIYLYIYIRFVRYALNVVHTSFLRYFSISLVIITMSRVRAPAVPQGFRQPWILIRKPGKRRKELRPSCS